MIDIHPGIKYMVAIDKLSGFHSGILARAKYEISYAGILVWSLKFWKNFMDSLSRGLIVIQFKLVSRTVIVFWCS